MSMFIKSLVFVCLILILPSCSLMNSYYHYEYYSVFERAPDNCILEDHNMYTVNGKIVFQYTCVEMGK